MRVKCLAEGLLWKAAMKVSSVDTGKCLEEWLKPSASDRIGLIGPAIDLMNNKQVPKSHSKV